MTWYLTVEIKIIMNVNRKIYRSLFSILLLTGLYFANSNSCFSQEMIVLSENNVVVEKNYQQTGLLVLPAQNITTASYSSSDYVLSAPIIIKFQNKSSETDLMVTPYLANNDQSKILAVKETKNKKSVAVQVENEHVSVVVSNKNGSGVENILPISMTKGEVDHSAIVTVISDKIFIADGTKLNVSGDLDIYWNQILNFECDLFSVSSENNLLTVKLVNGAEFVFNTDKDLTLLSFLPPSDKSNESLQLQSSNRISVYELNFSIVKDLKQFSPICKKKQQAEHFNNETVIAITSPANIVLHKVNLWSPVTGAVYDSESLLFSLALSIQTYPNFTQPNYQTLNNSGNIFISETQFC